MNGLAALNDTFLMASDRRGAGEDSDDLALVPSLPALNYSTIETCPQPTAKTLLRLTDYWRRKSKGGALPKRDAIDPTEIIVHLPWLFMVDVLVDGADYQYRLVGTSIVNANDRDVTRRTFTELYADPIKLEGARLGFDRALDARAPVYTRGRAFWRPDWTYDHFEAVFLPLSSDGQTVNIILGEIAYLTPR